MDGRRGLMMGRRPSAQIANVGDIAYKAPNGKIMVVAQDLWDASLGTPVGVVVIPSGFAPDNGKARIVSLKWGSSSGTGSTSVSAISWSLGLIDTSLTNYNYLPNTDNAGSVQFSYYGYLPSDMFSGATSFVDPVAKYTGNTGNTPYIPSPYLGDKPNPNYYADSNSRNNTLSDFNGKGNTDTLVALSSSYQAANAARSYKAAGAEEIEWYLPAAGELGYLEVRYKKINESLAKVLGVNLGASYAYFWSSTESTTQTAYFLRVDNGEIKGKYKTETCFVRPFAMLDF